MKINPRISFLVSNYVPIGENPYTRTQILTDSVFIPRSDSTAKISVPCTATLPDLTVCHNVIYNKTVHYNTFGCDPLVLFERMSGPLP